MDWIFFFLCGNAAMHSKNAMELGRINGGDDGVVGKTFLQQQKKDVKQIIRLLHEDLSR